MFRFFGNVGKQLDERAKVNCKIYDAINWETNNYNTHMCNISKSKGNQPTKFCQLIEYKVKNIFSVKILHKI